MHLSYTIDGLKLVQVPTPKGGQKDRPFFYARRIELGLHWRDLIHKHELVGNVELDGPKLNLILAPSKEGSQTKPLDPELGEKLKRLSPLDVERIELKRAEVAFADETSNGAPSLWLHDLDGTLENFATRVGLLNGEPTTLAASGTLQKTGQVSVFVTADPLAKKLGFSGRASVEGLALRDVGNFLEKKADLSAGKGAIDLFAEFDAHDGRIAGGVKPILKNVEVKPAKGGLGPKLKAWVADAALNIFSDRVPGRNAVAVVIPMQGTVNGPQAELWPIVWGVLRNAFVAGLGRALRGFPRGSLRKRACSPRRGRGNDHEAVRAPDRGSPRRRLLSHETRGRGRRRRGFCPGVAVRTADGEGRRPGGASARRPASAEAGTSAAGRIAGRLVRSRRRGADPEGARVARLSRPGLGEARRHRCGDERRRAEVPVGRGHRANGKSRSRDRAAPRAGPGPAVPEELGGQGVEVAAACIDARPPAPRGCRRIARGGRRLRR
ncbi:MAG TPA: DUF748 domain-containing protein [Myxococcales bacterium]|nr:DUF748 domain-containing protein [Myxococcales bacterium]